MLVTRGLGWGGLVTASWGYGVVPPVPHPIPPGGGTGGGAAGDRGTPWRNLSPEEFEDALRCWGLTIEEVFPEIPDEEIPPKRARARQRDREEQARRPRTEFCPRHEPRGQIRTMTPREVLEAALADVQPFPAKLKPGVRVILGAAGIFSIYRGLKKVAEGNLTDLVFGGMLMKSGLVASKTAFDGLPPPPKKKPR